MEYHDYRSVDASLYKDYSCTAELQSFNIEFTLCFLNNASYCFSLFLDILPQKKLKCLLRFIFVALRLHIEMYICIEMYIYTEMYIYIEVYLHGNVHLHRNIFWCPRRLPKTAYW